MTGVTEQQLDNWFRYHAPQSGQVLAYTSLRDAAYVFAKTILMHTPAGSDQTAAIRKVREVVMTANAAIACGGS